MIEKYLKEIAKELKLIRKEKELENNLLMQDMGLIDKPAGISIDVYTDPATDKTKPNIADQLTNMFKNNRQ